MLSVGLPNQIADLLPIDGAAVRMLATAHADSMEELQKKPVFDRLIREKRFERYVLLGNEPQIGTIQEIYDERGSLLYQDQEEKTAIC